MIKGGVVTYLQIQSWYNKYFKPKTFEIHQMQTEAFRVSQQQFESCHSLVQFTFEEIPEAGNHSDFCPPLSPKQVIL